MLAESHPMHDAERGPRKLSLSRELLLLARSAESLRVSATHSAHPANRGNLHDLILVIAGGLLLFRDRIRLAELVVVGEVNPGVIICKGNEADWSEDGPGVIAEWSREEAIERAEADRRGIRARLRWELRDRTPKSFVLHKKPEGNR